MTMKVLVACEYSGVVRDAFSSRGHDATSCDTLPTDKAGKHYQGDVRDILDEPWDLIIAHPPCTYMCNSGVCWLHKDEGRWQKLDEAAEFFRLFLDSPCPRVCVENPVMHKYAVERIGGRRQSQSVQPYEFGHPHSKRTCLWLKGLPLLKPTEILEKPASGKWENQTPSGRCKLPPSPDRWKLRSKTYQGIADAMADQWNGEHQLTQKVFSDGKEKSPRNKSS